MRVHVFGNSPSPSVANYCLRKAVCNHEGEEQCDNVCKYVKEHFYVDDGLLSSDSEKDIASLIKRKHDRLMTGGNIRLHKIISNSNKVLSSFPQKDLAKNITEIDFDSDASCLQRSLGLSWDVIRDIFTYQLSADEKHYTKRGVLSVINGIFDPIGFVAPVILGGRLIMRQALQNASVDWDDPLPEYLMNDWQVWKQSLKDLETLEIRRSFTETSLGDCSKCELHIFSDASKDAIASVAYIRTFNDNGHSQLGFVLGKSKLAPNHGHTIPRLELCAAVLATELASFIQKTLEIPSSATDFYTDSQVVLGYLYNETRRFYVYVSNRVDRILKVSTKLQWNYVPTSYTPADHGTRPLEVNSLRQSEWLKGPNAFFESQNLSDSTLFEVIEPEVDKEVRLLVEVKKTFVKSSGLDISLFEHFSTWTSLVRGIAFLKRKASMWHKDATDDKNSKSCVTFMKESEKLIIKEVQQDIYYNENDCLKKSKPLQKNSSLIALSPVLDSDGLLRVGGRLKNSDIESCEKMPVIIPGKSYIATLIVKHCHNAVQHMGRHFTEGVIRSRGIWLTGCKRLINSILHNCIKCRKLRGSAEQQKMADLPSDRLTTSPPFTYVGVDTFGPWSILTRRTRGGSANTKRLCFPV
ncbi:uncharacterized protein LOC134688168 [Mytilus trossulus]|uniref:uncharacterized protein LOC134688168 n=1 Tax=Mytilus trossulus TaxID=6551 RepID=UPI003007983C